MLVVFITHKLEEALDGLRRHHVLRRGAVVTTCAARDTSTDELAAIMVGDDSARRGVGDASCAGMLRIPTRAVGIPHSSPGNGVTEGVDANSRRGYTTTRRTVDARRSRGSR